MRLAVVFVVLAGVVLAGAAWSQAPPVAAVNARVAAPASNSLPARRLALVADRRYTMHAGIRPL